MRNEGIGRAKERGTISDRARGKTPSLRLSQIIIIIIVEAMRDPENRFCKCTDMYSGICTYVRSCNRPASVFMSVSLSCVFPLPLPCSCAARDISKTIRAHQHHRCQPLFPRIYPYILYFFFFCLPDIRTRHKSMFDFPSNNKRREIRKEREARQARTQDIMFAPCLKFFFPGLLFCFLFFRFSLA